MSFARNLLAGTALSLMAFGGSHAATLTNTNAIANFSGNECSGFQTCFAFRTTSGTPVGGGTTSGSLPTNALNASQAVIKFNQGAQSASPPTVGDQNTTAFPNVSNSNFTLALNSTARTLAYTYNNSANTLLTYIVVNQANNSYLFYNAAGFTADTFDLASMFGTNQGQNYSHITFFDSAGTGGIPGVVPEPATLALLGAGLLGLGMARRRRA